MAKCCLRRLPFLAGGLEKIKLKIRNFAEIDEGITMSIQIPNKSVR
jgi:hypothetical protein